MEGMNDAAWRKSSHSGGNGGGCVEVSNDTHVILVRDTKDRAGVVLAFCPNAWRQFGARIKGGHKR
jgi:uncharacterized protein DUF397